MLRLDKMSTSNVNKTLTLHYRRRPENIWASTVNGFITLNGCVPPTSLEAIFYTPPYWPQLPINEYNMAIENHYSCIGIKVPKSADIGFWIFKGRIPTTGGPREFLVGAWPYRIFGSPSPIKLFRIRTMGFTHIIRNIFSGMLAREYSVYREVIRKAHNDRTEFAYLFDFTQSAYDKAREEFIRKLPTFLDWWEMHYAV